jgi:uncharacterized protein (DUF2236 family)
MGQLTSHGLRNVGEIVDYYLGLLVDGDASPEARQTLMDYLKADGDDRATDRRVREMLHIIMSLPNHQLA